MLAERWFGIGSVVLAIAAAGGALRPTRHHPRWHHAVVPTTLELRTMRCAGHDVTSAPAPTAPTAPAAPAAYVDLIGDIDVHHCFAGAPVDRVDLLISIARDGRVMTVSSRPERPTAVSRCIEQELHGWRFSATPNDGAVSIRYAFTR